MIFFNFFKFIVFSWFYFICLVFYLIETAKYICEKKKRIEFDLQLRQLSPLFGNRFLLSLSNKRLVYIVMLKPVWFYELQLWVTPIASNKEIFQNKVLRFITGTPWYLRQKRTTSCRSKCINYRSTIRTCVKNTKDDRTTSYFLETWRLQRLHPINFT